MLELAVLGVAIVVNHVIKTSRDMEDEGAPVVHRCWNCDRPIPLNAIRCKFCGVEQ